MNSVITLGKDQERKEELILQCDCGGVTFNITSSGIFECTICGDVLKNDLRGVEISKRDDGLKLKGNHDHPSQEFAFRSVINCATPKDSAAVIVMQKSGTTRVWSEGYKGSKDQEEWFQSRVNELMEMLQ